MYVNRQVIKIGELDLSGGSAGLVPGAEYLFSPFDEFRQCFLYRFA